MEGGREVGGERWMVEEEGLGRKGREEGVRKEGRRSKRGKGEGEGGVVS